MENMKIFASPSEYISEGFVWLEKAGLPARGIVKITNSDSRKSVFCEALQFEGNFLKKYNQSPRIKISEPKLSIVMNGWYRARLGNLKTQCEYPLEITKANSWFGKIRACMHHPQVVVRVAVLLSLLSVMLSIGGAAYSKITSEPKASPLIEGHTRKHFKGDLDDTACPSTHKAQYYSKMIEFFLNPNFLIPFLSTVGASLTIIILQSAHRIHDDRKKKLYTVAYMTDVCIRLLQSSLILKKNTIIPHIEAAKKMIAGDQDLLKTTFLADEFDVLVDDAIDFSNLSEEFKVLVGYDDIQLLQAFETILYLNRSDRIKNSFNDFVKLNLKSELSFMNKNQDEQVDILNTYWDYLDKLDHREDRIIAFILHIFIPKVRQYIKRKCFLLYSKKNIRTSLNGVVDLHCKNKNIIQDSNFFEKSISNGIQKIVREH